MDQMRFPDDFKEFLKLLEEYDVEYLLIGGYAVGLYGYPRTTYDMDIWVGMNPENARKMVQVMTAFGFSSDLLPEIFLDERCLIRLGVPPLRLELLTSIDGVEFESAYERRLQREVAGIRISMISLADLRKNKKASGRHKDLADLEHLPTPEKQVKNDRT